MRSASCVPRSPAPSYARFHLGTHEELLAARGKYYQLYTGNQIAE